MKKYGIPENRQIRPNTTKRKLLRFLFFVLLSGLFWLTVKLSNDFTVTCNYKLSLTDVPPEYWLIQTEAFPLRVIVTTNGFNLLKNNFIREDSRDLDVSLITVPYRKLSKNQYYILVQNIFPVIAADLGVQESDIQTNESEIHFDLEGQLSVDVPVILRQKIEYKQQYGPYGPAKIDPEFVKVYGARSVLDTLSGVYTETILIKDADQSFVRKVKLDLNPKQIVAEIPEVMVEQQVEKFTENSLQIPILKPLNSKIKLFPETATVYFQVAMKDYKLLNPNHFTIYADTTGIKGKMKYLPLQMINSPENIRFSRMEPNQVEYLIMN
ncbi:MAG: CdaR family protein [Bacteroidales bacterium]